MLKRICINGSVIFLPLLFTIGTISIRDYLADVIGHTESALLLFLFILFILILVFFHFTKTYLKYTLGIFLILIGLASIVLFRSSKTEHRLEKAFENHVNISMTNLNLLPKDEKAEVRAKYIQIETKATELELEAAELRSEGPNDYYGESVYISISFYAFAFCSIALGICWILYERTTPHSSHALTKLSQD